MSHGAFAHTPAVRSGVGGRGSEVGGRGSGVGGRGSGVGDARPELLEKAATETRAHADAGVEHTRTRACASMSQLIKERARLESKTGIVAAK
jgi:hypothetical protein